MQTPWFWPDLLIPFQNIKITCSDIFFWHSHLANKSPSSTSVCAVICALEWSPNTCNFQANQDGAKHCVKAVDGRNSAITKGWCITWFTGSCNISHIIHDCIPTNCISTIWYVMIWSHTIWLFGWYGCLDDMAVWMICMICDLVHYVVKDKMLCHNDKPSSSQQPTNQLWHQRHVVACGSSSMGNFRTCSRTWKRSLSICSSGLG